MIELHVGCTVSLSCATNPLLSFCWYVADHSPSVLGTMDLKVLQWSHYCVAVSVACPISISSVLQVSSGSISSVHFLSRMLLLQLFNLSLSTPLAL